MSKEIIGMLIITFLTTSLRAQQQPQHEKKIHKDQDGKVYVNKDLPVYLSISTDKEGSDSEILEGKDPKYTSPMYLDSEGYNSIRSPWKVDPETKKIVYPKEEVVFELYADSKAPQTSISFGEQRIARLDGKVILGSGAIVLSSTDETSGIASIYYSVDGGVFEEYTSAIALNDEKSYVLKYYAVDKVGNTENLQSINIQIDKSAPASSLAVEGDLSENVVSNRSTIELTTQDNVSKDGKIFYTIDEGKTFVYSSPINLSSLSEGEHTLTYFAVDDVDNNEEKKTYSFFLDKSAPRVIDEIIGNTFIANGKEYYSGRTKLKLVAMDNKAGVKEIRYSVNGGEFKLYESPFYLTQSGNLNIEVLAMDKVNNTTRTTEFSDKNSLISYVDLSGPSLSYNLSGPAFDVNDTIFITKETKFDLRGTDKDSGFKEIDYQVDGGLSQTFSEPFNIEEDGFHVVTYNGYDNLSNSSTKKILCIVDNTGPEVYNRFSIDTNRTRVIEGETVSVFPPHVLLFLSSTDQHAGLDKISYQINGGTPQPYKSLIENFRKNNLYRINVSVTDKLGNENQEEIVFYVE
ncbi:chitobiase/beta-hexosaminidase C-terminal domain-containing protein [Ekhidna sp.]|uniref:chitobiase/beta-hexosaminidase C-terminal domain-containing protein n=1 Tax=Ekhidna sp. TaxID=2608089 RepID=UPI003B50B67B